MRILCLTNFYPPYEIGGEEQSCYDVMQQLKKRGHRVKVLTSRHGLAGSSEGETDVMRQLYLEMELNSRLVPLRFFFLRRQREQANLRVLREVVQGFNPDVIFMGPLWNIPRSVPALAEQLCPGRVLYRFGSYWPALPSQHVHYWQAPPKGGINRVIKPLLGRMALRRLEKGYPLPQLTYPHAYCISQAVRQGLVERGIPLESAPIIHNGVDTAVFYPKDNLDTAPEGLRLLYAGRICWDKGVHTAVEALDILVKQRAEQRVTLHIAGFQDPTYTADLRKYVTEHRLEPWVTFGGAVPKQHMPELLRAHDALVFPSIWPEPFGRSLIEAMASGLPVLCTPVGGVPEVVGNGNEGLYFAPGDASDLVLQINRLLHDRDLCMRLAQAGAERVRAYFDLNVTMSQIENLLFDVVDGQPRNQG